jgi:hypothetical protein
VKTLTQISPEGKEVSSFHVFASFKKCLSCFLPQPRLESISFEFFNPVVQYKLGILGEVRFYCYLKPQEDRIWLHAASLFSKSIPNPESLSSRLIKAICN